ncbi:SDR family NAD(P)-dependent oxidoreductase [Clavibacter phaseoli]|uniref:SDR family NAD(P)-dependent oxidoreductase n=1 Tax=Clavibacter phaseoli TaxID=1734031 RepID=UPI000E672467|nr:SDR family NAD(P)-dependent oxidoreductase [Clavibacter phaseoli]RIJ57253.1 SDR family NAD(P)-dependent oxidoreductase [Clavibacter phaseoli]UKF31802.1 SDR family NAD(P)-dependent oxidoreductase [Clavibacter phaseoli]UKF37722.1 SDR family NAD(P)-dependent oxidoreductase [Clavibacter phaseoli]
MPLITIIGAGPGLGLEIARAFGRKGFDVALVARDRSKLDGLARTLAAEGIRARGFTADVNEPDTIRDALRSIRDELGPIDVLEFSPADRTLESVDAVDVTMENLQPQIDFYLGGAVAAIGAVLPDMIAAGSGTVLVTTGGGSLAPTPARGNINIAAAGLRNWTLNLHAALAERGVYVAFVAITALIGGGRPDAEPDVIAQAYVTLHDERQDAELHYVAYDA